MKAVSAVLPFRVNEYVTDELIDWSNIPEDPIYQLTFPQEGMLKRKQLRYLALFLLLAGLGLSGKAVYIHAKADLAKFLLQDLLLARRQWIRGFHPYWSNPIIGKQLQLPTA